MVIGQTLDQMERHRAGRRCVCPDPDVYALAPPKDPDEPAAPEFYAIPAARRRPMEFCARCLSAVTTAPTAATTGRPAPPLP